MAGERFHVYMLATRKDGPLYVGITNDLGRRLSEHKEHTVRGYTARYNVDRLVWCEAYDDPAEAIAREKALKKWRREWKITLIEADNPDWRELGEDLGF